MTIIFRVAWRLSCEKRTYFAVLAIVCLRLLVFYFETALDNLWSTRLFLSDKCKHFWKCSKCWQHVQYTHRTDYLLGPVSLDCNKNSWLEVRGQRFCQNVVNLHKITQIANKIGWSKASFVGNQFPHLAGRHPGFQTDPAQSLSRHQKIIFESNSLNVKSNEETEENKWWSCCVEF